MVVELQIEEMLFSDFQEVCDLWRSTSGLYVTDAANPQKLGRYLERNPGFSSICKKDGKIVGAVLCGHDGLIGYIYHMVVNPELRGQRVGKALVDRSLGKLSEIDISMCRLFVSKQNVCGVPFWKALGWIEREGVSAMWVPVSATPE